MVVADVIFPAFFTPYFVLLVAPWLIPLVLGIEMWFMKRGNPATSWGRVVVSVLCANAVSAVAGVVLAWALPSGYTLEEVDGHNQFHAGPLFGTYILLAFPLLAALSILIEGLSYEVFKSDGWFVKVWEPCFWGNVAGYALIGLGIMAVALL